MIRALRFLSPGDWLLLFLCALGIWRGSTWLYDLTYPPQRYEPPRVVCDMSNAYVDGGKCEIVP